MGVGISDKRVKVTRDNVLLVCGLVGIAFEALNGLERPSLLLLYAGMIGLPRVLNKDEKNQARRNELDSNSGDNNVP